MKTVGVVAESPNDFGSIVALLKSNYPNLRFKHILPRERGGKLLSAKFTSLFEAEMKSQNLDCIVCMRDLDGVATETAKVDAVRVWYRRLSTRAACKSTLLVNIYEIEALILSDIAALNKVYRLNISFSGDPMMVVKPKEFLQREVKRVNRRRTYKEGDSPRIFSNLDFDTVANRCRYFRTFCSDFDKQIA